MEKSEKLKIIDSTILKIEKAFGKGSIMKLGEASREPVEVIPTGCLSTNWRIPLTARIQAYTRVYTGIQLCVWLRSDMEPLQRQ